MAGTNVAKLPKKYAMLHFTTPLPVFDLANSQPCNKEVCHLASILLKVLRPLEGFTMWRSEDLCLTNGVRSFVATPSVKPSKPGESPNVTVRLTRSPVLGRMRVAWRSYAQYSVSLPYAIHLLFSRVSHIWSRQAARFDGHIGPIGLGAHSRVLMIGATTSRRSSPH